MIISLEEKAKIWDVNHGRCCKCAKTLNPFSELVFHAFNGKHIEIYCKECESKLKDGVEREKMIQ